MGYEEGRPEILAAMELGYPRFVMHPHVAALFRRFEVAYGADGERCLAFPSVDVTRRCARFLEARGWSSREVEPEGALGVHALFFPEKAFDDAKSFWQHFGKIISSRQAEAILGGWAPPEGGEAARGAIRERIAGLTGASTDNVWLFPSGMAAVSRALRMAQERRPGARSIQLGFPYVDVLKVQTVSGPGAHFVPDYNLDSVKAYLTSEPICALVCEFPGNPLLRGCSLSALSALARAHDIPLIVDDTAATYFNVQLFPYADILATSLTKSFSGGGDVMAGAIVLGPDSPAREEIARSMGRTDEDLLWSGDALQLEVNSRDFDRRMPQVNQTTERLCDWLEVHPAIDRVYYPKFTMRQEFDEVLRPGGGYGGLFSLLLKDPERVAPLFYDRLEVSKGPSLGNNFTLACPYTLLAHFNELDWAESYGVSRYLIRVSVGLESAEDLIARFDRALEGIAG